MSNGSRKNLLFLSHRIPYPPDKGDKIRSFGLLRKLSEEHRIFLGTFIDDRNDENAVHELARYCEDICAIRLRVVNKLSRSAIGLLTGQSLSGAIYRSRHLTNWIKQVNQSAPIDRFFAFSGPMGQYESLCSFQIRVVDFCDVDSEKWRQYSAESSWPMSWVYRRESMLLRALENDIARSTNFSLFATHGEKELFERQFGSASAKLMVVQNGVDISFFSPSSRFDNPYADTEIPVLFTGAMDYKPNIDAVKWFARSVLPIVNKYNDNVRFYVVGSNPSNSVRAIPRENPNVRVTGFVSDIRPWIQHAALAVAPLKIARGIQNKVLENLAMEKIVIATPEAATGLGSKLPNAIRIVDDEKQFAGAVVSALELPSDRLARNADGREFVKECFSWEKNLASIDELFR